MEGTINKVAVVGLGKVGSLVASLLHFDGADVTGFDQTPPRDLPFGTQAVDVANIEALGKVLVGFDAVVSCLPYFLNTNVAKVAMANKVHYFDLTEDVEHTKFIVENSASSSTVLVPQCGLAPGFIGIVGASLMREFESVRSLELRVGALPRAPHGLLGYAVNWSAEGIVNEYLNDAEVIREGKKKVVPSMQELETVILNGIKLEAFITSGGLGTMTDTYEGIVETLDYKTLRYPGHCELMSFLADEMRLRNNRELIAQMLLDAKPQTTDDVVYIYAAAEGQKDNKLVRDTFVRAYHTREINGKHWRAISWTTAASCCAVIELVSTGVLAQQGFIKQEDIGYSDLVATSFGTLFTDGVAVTHSSHE
ncbi:MAG TPA: saccharopine dehydrogenase C-terminal domain-containing protein [Acidimicrobiia bacterium]|nr:saccharopine dehydrogenase C-terminal domain-containing protein [Acidimicrobiia bacterium]